MNWSKEIIKKTIREIYENGEPINSGYIQKNYYRLFSASRNYFGAWKNAIEASGFSYKEISKNKSYTEDSLIVELQYRHNKGIKIVGDKKIQHWSVRLFGSMKNAIESANIDYQELLEKSYSERQPRRWSKEIIIDIIKSMENDGQELTTRYLEENHNDLYNATFKYFGSYNNALSEAGINRLEHYKESPMGMGYKFEYAVMKALELSGTPFERDYYMDDNVRPDFLLDNDVWLEVKTNIDSKRSKYQIRKYRNLHSNIVVVYIFGSTFLEGVKYINAYDFINRIDIEEEDRRYITSIIKEVEQFFVEHYNHA